MDEDDPREDGTPQGDEPEPTSLVPGLEPEPDAVASDAEGPDAPERDGPTRPPRHTGLKVIAVVGGVLVVTLFLVGWNRVASTDAFCGSCHEVEPATQAAARSVHADVACLECHTGPGLAGTVRYLPTLARETLSEFTPLDVAHGVLEARSCESCHTDLSSTPALAAAHDTGRDCAACHGDVAHPPFRLVGFSRPLEPIEGEVHPRLYIQIHGDDAVAEPSTCTECHERDFCETCHLRETYPHPDDWITEHGPTQQDLGITACDGCHPETFCAGCHGTEIPHDARWLGEHWRDLEDAPVTPCLLCHPKTDCTTCHAEHGVHREQDLFQGVSS